MARIVLTAKQAGSLAAHISVRPRLQYISIHQDGGYGESIDVEVANIGNPRRIRFQIPAYNEALEEGVQRDS